MKIRWLMGLLALTMLLTAVTLRAADVKVVCRVAAGEIANLEGFVPTPYYDGPTRYSIGYGTIARHDDVAITEAEDLIRLRQYLWETVLPVLDGTDFKEYRLGQQIALLSFIYNVGPAAFRRSTLRKQLVAGRLDLVPHELWKWNRVTRHGIRQSSEGLKNRRRREIILWSNV